MKAVALHSLQRNAGNTGLIVRFKYISDLYGQNPVPDFNINGPAPPFPGVARESQFHPRRFFLAVNCPATPGMFRTT
jgi:hypothetical protein